MQPDQAAIIAAAQQFIRAEASGLQRLADEFDATFLEVVSWLFHCQGKVFVAGSGTSRAIGTRMAHLLSVCGTPAVSLQPMDALHGTMGAVTAQDIVIAISRGGRTNELNELTERVKQRGARVIALTSNPAAPLAQLADLTVILPTDDTIDPGGVIAMGSTLVVGAWGDALAQVLMRLRGYSWDEMLFTHPAGAVGVEEHPDLSPLERLDSSGL